MLNKVTIITFVVAVMLYILLLCLQAKSEITNFVLGVLVGMILGIVGTRIAQSLKNRSASQE